MHLLNQLNQKLSFIKEIESLTYNLIKAVEDEEIEMLDEILSKRQHFMDEVDEIDNKIQMYEDNNESQDLKNKIKNEVKNIIDLDMKVKAFISKKELEARRKFTEADLKLKTGNYDMSDEKIKPKGYFLNVKS